MFMVWTCQFGYKFLSGHFSLFLTLIEFGMGSDSQILEVAKVFGFFLAHLQAIYECSGSLIGLIGLNRP